MSFKDALKVAWIVIGMLVVIMATLSFLVTFIIMASLHGKPLYFIASFITVVVFVFELAIVIWAASKK